MVVVITLSNRVRMNVTTMLWALFITAPSVSILCALEQEFFHLLCMALKSEHSFLNGVESPARACLPLYGRLHTFSVLQCV